MLWRGLVGEARKEISHGYWEEIYRDREREREKRKALESRRKAQCGNSLGHDRHYHNFFSMSPNEGDTECVEGVRRASRQTTGRAKQVGVLERANGVKGHPVYLSVHGSAAGCNLMSFLCWFRLYRVTRVSRSFVFVFRVFHHHHHHHLLPSRSLELSSVSDPFKIRLLSCRLGCRRLWLKAIRAQRLLKRDHVPSRDYLSSREIFLRSHPKILTTHHPILFHLIFLDGLSTDSIAPVWIAARLGIAFMPAFEMLRR